MTTNRTDRAKQFLARISGGQEAAAGDDVPRALERVSQLTSVPPETVDAAHGAARKMRTGEPLSSSEQFALEAIIIPDKRPAIDIVNGDYNVQHPDWISFNDEPIKSNLRRIIQSVGRIELPHHPTMPYGGTGFIVGDGLLMTNRHVAGKLLRWSRVA